MLPDVLKEMGLRLVTSVATFTMLALREVYSITTSQVFSRARDCILTLPRIQLS